MWRYKENRKIYAVIAFVIAIAAAFHSLDNNTQFLSPHQLLSPTSPDMTL